MILDAPPCRQGRQGRPTCRALSAFRVPTSLSTCSSSFTSSSVRVSHSWLLSFSSCTCNCNSSTCRAKTSREAAPPRSYTHGRGFHDCSLPRPALCCLTGRWSPFREHLLCAWTLYPHSRIRSSHPTGAHHEPVSQMKMKAMGHTDVHSVRSLCCRDSHAA